MFDAAALPALIRERYASALAAGALRPVATEARRIEDGGIPFVVRIAQRLRDKAAAAGGGEGSAVGAVRNPFLPYDEALFVAAPTPTHVVLFNKYNVIDRHLLIVTRQFEDQETLLTAADWRALWCCLDALGGLAFYNGGRAAGASQPHKHLQLVPLPLAADGPAIPVEPMIEAALAAQAVGALPAFDFQHAVCRLDPALRGDAAAVAAARAYGALLAALGIAAHADRPGADDAALRQAAPYNLLLTPAWMLVVARRREDFAGISVNALGFAGSLFVRDEDEARRIGEVGPLRVLAEVAMPRG